MKKTVSMIGCGALGRILALNFKPLLSESYELAGVYAHTFEHAEEVANSVRCKAYSDFRNLLDGQADYVIEIAGIAAVAEYGEAIPRNGSNLVIVSVGALADQALKARLLIAAAEMKKEIYVVNGAIGGFDLMQTLSLMGNTRVSIESTKSPKGLNGAPYLSGRTLSEENEETIFSGNVVDAIRGFPKNVNIAVATSLATNASNIEVRIKSKPNATESRSFIQMRNQLVRAEIDIHTQPDPMNPRSSISTAWSVIALLKNLASVIHYF